VDAVAFFLVQHGQVHAAEIAGGASYFDRVFATMSDAEMRARPGPGLNSLVWLLWHMARVEDVAVNLVIAQGSQVLDDDWARRMNAPWRTFGTGMSDGDVSDFTARADIEAVRAYRSAVARQTRQVVHALRPEAWEEIIGPTDTARAAAAGAFTANPFWAEGAGYKPWQGVSRAGQLAGSALRHNAVHIGEAVTIRALAGFPLGI
jgi:hypothetical protein